MQKKNIRRYGSCDGGTLESVAATVHSFIHSFIQLALADGLLPTRPGGIHTEQGR